MTTSAIAIFTGKATPVVLEAGGSQSWVLDRTKARRSKYAVLYFNEHATWSNKGYTGHHEAFLVGRISDIVPSTESPGRYLILFDEYAEVEGLGRWGGWRNPIRYTTLEELGIDQSKLEFTAMPDGSDPDLSRRQTGAAAGAVGRLTIEGAKAGLAATYGVKPEAIEIIIRG